MTLTKPPMGWNSWNTFGENVNEKLILESADALVSSGLAEVGYEYVVIDDCWAEKERGKDGRLVPDPNKFPNGMKWLSDEIHRRGLKFGMYSCAGVMTCMSYPSSMDREFTDAQTFAEWGIDFLKYDYCYKPVTRRGETAYRAMSLALANSGRDILFSACNWGADSSHAWIRSTGADVWRSTGDIKDNWISIKNLITQQFSILPYGGKGCFNDMDMLVVGMNGKGNVGLGGCSAEEYATHFNAWCMLQSPLFIGCDVRNTDEFTLNLLKNRELISIAQDEKCAQTFRADMQDIDKSEAPSVFGLARFLANGDIALGFFNLSDEEACVRVLLDDLGLNTSANKALALTDCGTGERSSSFNGAVNTDLKPHCSKIYRARLVSAR